MLENERIIVQDRGFDAGLAALMQNANRGNFDPTSILAMMNNGGFGGNGSWWLIFIVMMWMWGGWGGNGFGRNGINQAETNADFARLVSLGNQNNNTDLLMQAIQGNKDSIASLATTLHCDTNSIEKTICAIQSAVERVGGEVGFSAERVINAVNAGDCRVIEAINTCCCQTQRAVDGVNLNLTKLSYDNQLATVNQTNTLQNTLAEGFSNLILDNTNKFNVIGAKIDAQTQIINDKFCQLEMREMQNKIDTLREEKSALQLSASQQAQTASIVNQVRPCPVPAYLTCNPYDSYNPFGGYNLYGYNGYNGYNGGCNC